MNATSLVNCSTSKHSRERQRTILFRSTGTTASALDLSVCSPAISRRVLPMTTSAGSSTARLEARPSSDAPVATAGAVQIVSSQSRIVAMGWPSMATTLRESWRWHEGVSLR